MSKPTWEAKRTEWQSKESKDSEGKATTTAGAGTAQKVNSDSIAAVATLKIKMTHKKISGIASVLEGIQYHTASQLEISRQKQLVRKMLAKSVSASLALR
jgi:hypothetical protein